MEQGGAKRAAYGERLLPQLGQALAAEFGRGFDASNLRHMRAFYLAFPIRDALRRELGWTHYRLLLRVDSTESREWYAPEAAIYSTGISVCLLVLNKCKKPDDVLFINAAEHFVKGKRQNQLSEEHIARIVRTYQSRDEQERYARRVTINEIADNAYNLNISRYVSTAPEEVEVDLVATHAELVRIEAEIREATAKHNAFLRELGLPLLP